MAFRSRTRPRLFLDFDQFEPRLALSASPASLTIPLDPTFDQFGSQIETIQAYGDPAQATFGIFDTGASVVTVSAEDRSALDGNGGSIPVKVPGGALADGIGGDVIGDVSEPGTIWADGIHASSLTFDDWGFPTFEVSFGPDSAQTPGVQVFLGTDYGSPDLPTVTGVPVLNPSPAHPDGLAALVDLQGYQLDFSDIFPGLILAQPDLHFVSPGTTLTGTAETTAPVRIPINFVGEDNHTNPGDLITSSPNPVVNDVSLVSASGAISQQSFLFDTGAQLTVISTAEALALGLDLANPESIITVQGVGGTEDVPGFTLPSLTVPLSDGGTLQFTNVPVYVLDAAPGVVDGILGMNLLNTAAQALYNPFDPAGASLSLTFNLSPDRGLEGGFSFFTLLSGRGPFTLGSPGAAPSTESETGSDSSPGQPSLEAPSGHANTTADISTTTNPDLITQAPILVGIPGAGGTSLGRAPTGAQSGSAATVATPQGPAITAARPAQSLSRSDRVVESGADASNTSDEAMVHSVEDTSLDPALSEIEPALQVDPGAVPVAPLPFDLNGTTAEETPVAMALSGTACDHWLAELSEAGASPGFIAESAAAFAEEASSALLPAAVAAGLSAALSGYGYGAALTAEFDSMKRRRSAIRLVLERV